MASRHLEGRRSFHPDKSSLIPLEATSPLPRHAAGIRRRQSTYFRYTVLLQKMPKMTFSRITVNTKSYGDAGSICATRDKGKFTETPRCSHLWKLGNRANLHVNGEDFTTMCIRSIARARYEVGNISRKFNIYSSQK